MNIHVAGQCRGWAMLSGDYSVTDSMLVASSSSDADHSPAKSRIFPGNTGSLTVIVRQHSIALCPSTQLDLILSGNTGSFSFIV